ncbi:MAG TPA: hypothetical protein VGI07_00105, partial [Solirubrobacteraceae bacterium]
MGAWELEMLLARRPALRRTPRSSGGGSSADSIRRLQGMAGNSAVAALLQRAPAGGSPAPASIGEALSEIKVTTT